MTDATTRRMAPAIAALIGVVVQIVLSAILDQLGGGRDLAVRGGVQALVLLVSTAVGAVIAARLSGRKTPAWIVGAVGLLAGIAFLFIEAQAGGAAPLWVAFSTLGAPLLGARIGEAARD